MKLNRIIIICIAVLGLYYVFTTIVGQLLLTMFVVYCVIDFVRVTYFLEKVSKECKKIIKKK